MIGVSTPAVGAGMLAMASKPQGRRVEPKICEGWRCGRMFFREAASNSVRGGKLCPSCREREERLKLFKL
jgi:hypothetical protein